MSLGNPAPLGLLAFGMTTAMLMFVETGWAEPAFAEMVSGYAVFMGGLLQIIVAIFELQKGSSFSFAVFGSYGAFWLGWALVFIQGKSDTSGYVGSGDYDTGHTLWFIQWGVLTLCFWVITWRKNICLIVIFALLAVTFFLLAAATATEIEEIKKAAGYFGFFTAAGAWYTGVAELVNEEYGSHVLPGLRPMISPERLEITKDNITSKRTSYDSKSNTLFLQFRGLQVKTLSEIEAIREGVEETILQSNAPDKKVHVVVDYEDVLIHDDVSTEYWNMVADLQQKYYLSARRFHVTSFGTPSHPNSYYTPNMMSAMAPIANPPNVAHSAVTKLEEPRASTT